MLTLCNIVYTDALVGVLKTVQCTTVISGFVAKWLGLGVRVRVRARARARAREWNHFFFIFPVLKCNKHLCLALPAC